MYLNSTVRAVLAVAALTAALSAQSVISARSGLIHLAEGEVLLNGKPVEARNGTFADIKDSQILSTQEGRAEILLTPGVFLRVGENSSIQMVSSKLASTKVEVLTGSALLEVGELLDGNSITLVYKNQSIEFRKRGLFRVDADNGTFRVFDGEATVVRDGATFAIKGARMVDLTGGVLTASKFDTKNTDSFHRWASRRASYLSLANVAAAKELYDYGTTMAFGQWAWNPWFGMFTYIPNSGSYYSPFGYNFWSPGQVGRFYNRPVYNGGGGGWNGGGSGSGNGFDSNLGYNVGSRGAGMGSSGGYSGGGNAVSGGGGGGGAAAPAPSSRGGDTGGGRGSSTGGGRSQ